MRQEYCHFYTNVLAETPSMEGNLAFEHTIECLHDLESLYRWTKAESVHHTEIGVPAVFAGYNFMINDAERFDQMRSTNRTRRKEVTVPMSLLPFALETSISNAFVNRNVEKLDDRNDINPWEFKR